MTAKQVARYLGHAPAWFSMNRDALEAAGFPRRDALLGRYDKRAIDIWLDGRAGLEGDGDSGIKSRIKAVLGNGRDQGPSPRP